MRAFKPGMGPTLLALLAVTGCGPTEREPQVSRTSVQALQTAPDFVVTAVTGPASILPGQSFTAQVTVCNQGGSPSNSTEVELYLSADATIRADTSSGPPEDSRVTGAPVPPLAPGQCTTLSLSGQAYPPPTPGGPSSEQAFYLGAVVDPRNSSLELLEDNNTFTGKRMGVGSGPDFIVTAVTGPASTLPGQSLSAQVTVCNQGTLSGSTEVELYLSADATIRADTSSGPPEDSRVTGAPVPMLAPGQCTTLSLSGQAYPPPPSNSSSGNTAYYLGAVVDPRNSRLELLEDNNTFTGKRMGVGSGPDFVVTAVTGPASTLPGQALTAQVTVCNQGTLSDSTEVELYLSADATIRADTSSGPPEDSRVTGAPVPTLAPGQCTTLSLSGQAYPPPPSNSSSGNTAYYLGAVVDPRNSRPELLEDNNATAGKRMGVGSAADFIVTAVTGPASALPGQSLSAQVTVCNQGTLSDSTEVELYLSADATIRADTSSGPPEDSRVTGAPVPTLTPGQCITLSLSGQAYPPPTPVGPSSERAFYLGAVVDPRNSRFELLEDNNATAGKRMGVGSGPDFVVTAVTGPASALPGQALSAQVTVCNQGTLGENTEVELYLSADATIRADTSSGPSEDSRVTGAPVPPLAPGQCTTLSLSGQAYPPPTPGGPSSEQAFYLGAVVDPRNSRLELLEDNNTFTGKRMGVGSAADFIVTAVTGPASILPGQSLSAQVTVCNQGTLSDSTEVELYLSADATIRADTSSGPPEDSRVTGAPVPMLAPGQCTTVPLSGQAYPPPPSNSSSGNTAYYLGAVVDPRNSRPELLEDNNTFTGKRMGVGFGPDFVVTAVTGPASTLPGQSLSAQVTVCNQGTLSDSTEVELYLSADTTIRADTSSGPPEDSRVTGAPVPTLAPGQCTTVPLSGQAYPPPPSSGNTAYYLGAVVDPRNSRFELLEDNNATAGKRMGVGSGPDFVVTAVTGPASTLPGQALSAQVTVCNQGTLSDSTEVELYLSADTTIRADTSSGPPEDSRVTGAPVPTLAPGQCTTLSLSGQAYPPPSNSSSGNTAYYLGAVVDPRNSRPELLEDNNATAGKRMGVGSGPDFIVTAVTGPASALPGQALSAQVTVCNQGTLSDSTEVELYLSADTTIRADTSSGPPEDSRVTGAPVPMLTPGQCTTLSLSGQAYPPPSNSSSSNTAYYLGAVVDPRNSRPELLKDNNTFTGKRMGVGSGPDFVVTAVTGPASILPGQALSAQVTVCNQGTLSDSTDVELYLSADATIRADTSSGPPEDSRVTGAPVPMLAPGQCTTLSLSGQAYPPPPSNSSSGNTAYYLGAVVDPRNSRPELLEDNNTFTGKRMGVGSGPDFVVTAVTGPASALPGQSFTAQVTVCNQGTLSDSTEVELYLSADTTIRADTSSGPPEDSRVTGAPVPTLAPGQCTTVPLSGQAYPPPPSNSSSGNTAYYLGAVVDPRNSRPELLEDNNATAGKRMGVGFGPDFVVTVVTGPASALPGQALSTQVTVCNQGTLSDSTEVELYLSADTTIRADTSSGPPEDSRVTGAPVPTLAPGQCTTVPLSGQAYPPPSNSSSGNTAFYLGAVVDPRNSRFELLEDNNATAGKRMGVGSGPDFVVTAVTGPASALPGQSLSAQVTVCNQGTLSDSTEVELYLSADTTIRADTSSGPPEDSRVTGASVPMLAPGQCTTLSLSGRAYPPPSNSSSSNTAYYLGAVVDPRNSRPELLEDNNTFTGKRMGVGSAADFVVTAVTGPASAQPGQALSAQVTVCNQGTLSDSTDVELYLSADATIRADTSSGPPEDSRVTGAPVPMLAPGQCTTVPLSGQAYPPPSNSSSGNTAYYLGAVVDPRNSRFELLEDNNATAGNVIVIR